MTIFTQRITLDQVNFHQQFLLHYYQDPTHYLAVRLAMAATATITVAVAAAITTPTTTVITHCFRLKIS